MVTSKDKTEKTAYLLERKAKGFQVSETATIITCTGCAAGCSPSRLGKKGFCTPCDPDPDVPKPKCEKTETLPATAAVKK
ncbi:hypothetical protein KORDIASMS9_00014 [Kordia sp. SMS9]|uniref:hypothetical protein n=1 Tax=Kordia sp. SMS9 TaxID=2282170 RepID=UPI000E0CEA81|nr:hypothetical protein [Kordia sp. SMS9]AXG67832.1 hypothetical protein KORDIASMS9_00014 [Kordia sp. SMS9]